MRAEDRIVVAAELAFAALIGAACLLALLIAQHPEWHP